MEAENHQLIQYFDDKSYSDLIFKFLKNEIYCSKALISRFSSQFQNLLKDPDVRIIMISDVQYLTFYLMIQQFYQYFGGKLDHELTILLELLILANKFSLDKLQVRVE